MSHPLRIGIIFSGRGSNMKALLDHIQAKPDTYTLANLICNKPQAIGISVAKAQGFNTTIIDHTSFDTKKDFETEISNELSSANVDIICLAGFMRILSAEFVRKWDGRIINIHPSLLPAYKGLNTHQRAIDDGAQWHGCTVHYVVADMDAGEIITQTRVPVEKDDTAETLGERVLNVEHKTFCDGLDLAAIAYRKNKSTKE